MDIGLQQEIDRRMLELDGTPFKENLGANAVLGVSLACARGRAMEMGVPLYRSLAGESKPVLPVPMLNIFNGGAHSGAKVALQEFMIRPVGAGNFADAVQISWQVINTLKSMLKKRLWSTATGDEGGFAPPEVKGGAVEVLELLTAAVAGAGFVPGRDVTIAIDVAASSFFRNGVYDYSLFEPGGRVLDSAQQIDFLASLVRDYPIDSIEDGMGEDEWEAWQEYTARLGGKCQLVGDDLFVTNKKFLQKGIDMGCANAILIKPNQIGTLTEVLETVELARINGYKCIISHRSGETADDFIADLAAGLGTGQIKTGSLARSERLAKYNRLLKIASEIC
jgi:enolase